MSWSTGLFDCTLDTKQCLDNCLCGPCSISRQVNAVEDSKPDTFTVGKCICPGLLPPLCSVFLVRRKVVEKYHIDEGAIGSCLRAWLCAGCAVCQHHRELTKRNCWPGGSCLHKQPGTYEMA